MPQIKKFNWVRRPSTWEYVQSWKSQRKAMAQKFLDDSSAASTAFTNAQIGLSQGLATLAGQAAVANAQKQLEAVKSQASSIGNSLDISA
jgi:hypothetical protein